ncbi:MAG: hypothetical protein AAB262_02090, partial [Elusimicrobiota bacterium]
MRTRRPAPLFVAAALICAALGGSPPASHATVLSVTSVQFSEAGKKLHDQISVLEADIVGHVTGSKPTTFTKLKERHKELKALFEQKSAGLNEGERAYLADTLRKHALLLAQGEALARKGERLDPRLEAVLRNAGGTQPQGDFNAIRQVADELVAAATAANPAAANKVFDNLLAQPGTTQKTQDALNAVRLDFAASKEPIIFTPPSAKGTHEDRLKLKTPPPPTTTTKKAQFTNQSAIALNIRHVALEKKIIAHLTGTGVSTFEKLKNNLEGLKTALAEARDIPEDERASLAELLLRDERLLSRGAALARGAARLDPRIEEILRAAADANLRAVAGTWESAARISV